MFLFAGIGFSIISVVVVVVGSIAGFAVVVVVTVLTSHDVDAGTCNASCVVVLVAAVDDDVDDVDLVVTCDGNCIVVIVVLVATADDVGVIVVVPSVDGSIAGQIVVAITVPLVSVLVIDEKKLFPKPANNAHAITRTINQKYLQLFATRWIDVSNSMHSSISISMMVEKQNKFPNAK